MVVIGRWESEEENQIRNSFQSVIRRTRNKFDLRLLQVIIKFIVVAKNIFVPTKAQQVLQCRASKFKCDRTRPHVLCVLVILRFTKCNRNEYVAKFCSLTRGCLILSAV